jgi:glucose-1-phosphate cytidylyltransferase
LFDYLVADENLVFEEGPMRNLVKDKQLMVFEHDGFWQPMDTFRDFSYLNGLVENGVAPWITWR